MSSSPKNRLRDVARKARGAVAADETGPSTDAGRLLASGLFDPWYYVLQTRTQQEPLAAAEHFLSEGAAAGLLPNPLTDATGLPPDRLVAALLDGTARAIAARPLLDVEVMTDLAPEATDHPGGVVGFYLQHAHAGAPVPALGPRSWPRFVEQRRQQSKTLPAILEAGIFDHAYYALQAGRAFASPVAAVWHFLETGESAGLSPSPLYERNWYRSKAGVTMPMTFRHFLRTGQVEGAAGPHFDGATYLARVPASAEHPGGPLGHYLAHAEATTPTLPAPGTGVEAVAFGDLRTALEQSVAGGPATAGDRVAGRVSAVVTTLERHLVREAIDRTLAEIDEADEVVVIVEGSDRDVMAILTAVYAADPQVRVVRAEGAGEAVDATTGEVLVLIEHDIQPYPGWLSPLVDALVPGVVAAQAMVLSADDTVWSAGIVSHGPHVVPGHFLHGHPVSDVPQAIHPDAVSSACLAVRAADLATAGGPGLTCGALGDVDLSLRLTQTVGGELVTVGASLVRRQARPGTVAEEDDQLAFLRRWGAHLPAADPARWDAVGLSLTGFAAGAGLSASRRRTSVTPVLTRTPRLVQDGPGAGLPCLRWAIKIAAKGGPLGDAWGDTYFAADLARGLRSWGQEAFVDRRGAHERPGSDHLDDVTVTLRGRWPAVSQPGATNVLWVISHPDEVPDDEITQGFDLVYSAGRTWASEVSGRTSQPVRTLWQATDTARFTPTGESMAGLGTLFVGRTRKVLRPIVRDAVEAGADLTIFGDGWGDFVDASLVRADHLDNDLVPAAYRGARIVLNDHWADMARLGFYSNRLFDAVAAGARVVSDPVEGLEDVFGPSVQTYRSVDELRTLLDPASTAWADDATLAANAMRVAAEHSFTARAGTLLADVLDARGVEHVLRGR